MTYMIVTNDELEIPVAVGRSCGELSRMTGIDIGSLSKSLNRGRTLNKKKWKVVKVEDDEE